MFDADKNAYYRNDHYQIASIAEIQADISLLEKIKDLAYEDVDRQKFSFSEGQVRLYEESEFLLNPKATTELKYEIHPDEEIRFYYNWRGDWVWSDFKEEPPYYTNGLLISHIDFLALTAEKVKEIKLPYPILKSFVYGRKLCEEAEKISFSLNNKDWVKTSQYCQNNIIKLKDVFPKGKAAKITHNYFLRFESSMFKRFFLPEFFIYTQFQVAPKSIPKLENGENKIELKNENKVKVSFVFEKKK